jgi:hypothetical protein
LLLNREKFEGISHQRTMAHRVLDIARQHRGARDLFNLFYLHESLTTDTQKFQRIEYIVKQILQKELALDIATRTKQEENLDQAYHAHGMLHRGGFYIVFRAADPNCAEIEVNDFQDDKRRGSFRLCQGEGSTGKLYYKPPPPPDYDDQPDWLVWEDMYVDHDEVDTPPVRSRAGSEGEMGGRRRRRRTRRRKQTSRGKKI